jgi:hypothetical protein
MDDKVNLAEKLASFDDPFQPRIVGYYKDNKLMVGKLRGEFVWHKHDDTDDFFLVVAGPDDDSASQPRRRARPW